MRGLLSFGFTTFNGIYPATFYSPHDVHTEIFVRLPKLLRLAVGQIVVVGGTGMDDETMFGMDWFGVCNRKYIVSNKMLTQKRTKQSHQSSDSK